MPVFDLQKINTQHMYNTLLQNQKFQFQVGARKN